jgi:hypothetical protein
MAKVVISIVKYAQQAYDPIIRWILNPHAVKDAMVHLICVGSVRIRVLFHTRTYKKLYFRSAGIAFSIQSRFRVNLLA